MPERRDRPAPDLPPRAPNCLERANDIVEERMSWYGRPSENHARTAKLWSAYIGVELDGYDVCHLNSLQKISRDRNRRKQDNLDDIAGFTRNAEIVAQDAAKPDRPPPHR